MTAIDPLVAAKLREYENLMIQKRVIEESLEAIKEVITPELPADAVMQTDLGTFTMESRLKWTYSPETQEAEKQLKETKAREEQDGKATSKKGSPYLVYRLKNDKE